jgi:PAS domain S-box-containing protein
VKSGEAQRWLAAIVESSDDAIIGKKLDGTIVSWNAAATRMFGFTPKEIIGESILKLFPPELKHEETTLISRLVRGERVEHYETTRVRRDGSRVDVSLSLSPILDSGGAIVGASTIVREVTEAKQLRASLRILNESLEHHAVELERRLKEAAAMAQELQESNEQLNRAVARARQSQREAEAANRFKNEFLATMSHELRTPLNAIGGYADLMDADVLGQLPLEYRDYLNRIRKSQEHLLDLISGLLDFSKLEAGRLQLDLAPVSVGDLFTRLEPMVLPQAQTKQQELRFERPADDLRVQADGDRALQILLNLVSNAIKFTRESGSISVAASADSNSSVVIRVQDTGAGIEPVDIERIFEPFVQIDKSLTREHPGSGLGLAISRELARAMGGDITVESTPGRGSTFALTLQRAHLSVMRTHQPADSKGSAAAKDDVNAAPSSSSP